MIGPWNRRVSPSVNWRKAKASHAVQCPCMIKWHGLVAIAVLASVISGCGPGKFSGSSTKKSNTLTYALINTPTEFDPALVQDGDTIDLIQNIFEGLTTWSEDNRVMPNLAKGWDLTDGGRTYVFHL